MSQYGLAAALRTAVRRCPLTVTVGISDVGRYTAEVETTVYFCCIEAIQNTVRHAGVAARLTIRLYERNGLTFEISDTGVGCDVAVIQAGHGFAAMSERLGAVSGSIKVAARPGAGVQLTGHVPGPFAGDPRCGCRRRFVDATCRILVLLWAAASRSLGKLRAPTTAEEHVATGLLALLIPATASTLFTLGVYGFVHDRWLLVIASVNLGDVIAFAVGCHLARKGRIMAALFIPFPVIWSYCLALTPLAPVTLHQTPLLMILPVILIIPYVRGRTFMVVTGVTVLVALTVAMEGRLLSGVGIQEAAPGWLLEINLINFITLDVVLALYMISLNHSALTGKTEVLRRSLARLVAAGSQERRRIERDLHDGAQQRLVAAAIEARVAHRLLATRPHQVSSILAQLNDDLEEADRELCALACGIYPAELTEHGLEAALSAAAQRSPLPTTIKAIDVGRYTDEIEANVYFCCLEALQNAIKHAGRDATVVISIRHQNDLSFDVRDTGAGCEPSAIGNGHGFANMSDRVAAVGGTLTFHARCGAGVHLHGRVPLTSPGYSQVS